MAANTHAVQRDSMAERVKRELLRRILQGELPPGSRLVELQIARDLNTSQGPVREALRELEAMDLITREPYKGSRVREVTAQDLRDAYVVRASLEQLAGRLAAPHFKGSVADLRLEAAAIRTAARRKDIGTYAVHDSNFHRLIVAGASNRILLRTWDSLAFEVRIQLRLSKSKFDLVTTQDAHWRIIDALEKGEAQRAGKLLYEHISAFQSPASQRHSCNGKEIQTASLA